MAFNSALVGLREASFHPPALPIDSNSDDAAEVPWVLLEKRAYVADCSNSTTACSVSWCGKQVQVTCCVASPPRVSYLCVFCRASGAGRDVDDHTDAMLGEEPEVIATEGNLVLLRIVVGTKKSMRYEHDFYIYRPGGHDGPSLTRLKRPPGDHIFNSNEVGLLMSSCDSSDGSSSDKFYMVAALCEYQYDPERGRFVLYLYNSKEETWTTTMVSVDEHQLQQYQEEGFFTHINTKVIAIGGEDDTIGFVDLWRGILLCDLRQVQDNKRLHYIPLPDEIRPDEHTNDDALLSRDIAVAEGRIRCVRRWFDWINDAWMATSWSRTTSLEGNWKMNYEIELSNMNVDNLQYELLPQPEGDVEGGPVPLFVDLNIRQPTLSLQNGDASVCFMVKSDSNDYKAWVIAVDMMQNKLQGVVEFDVKRYVDVGFAYLHSRISKYLKTS